MTGGAGSGKSAIAKRYLYEGQEKYDALFAFEYTDFDKESETEFSVLFGELTKEEILDMYQEAENKVFYVDAVEKYYILEIGAVGNTDRKVCCAWIKNYIEPEDGI